MTEAAREAATEEGAPTAPRGIPVLGALACLCVALLGIEGLERAPPTAALSWLRPSLVLALWSLPALALARWLGDPDPLESFALTRWPRPPHGPAAVLLLVILPLYTLIAVGPLGLGAAKPPALLELPALFLSQALGVALAEELFFRGALQSSLERRFGPRQGLVLSALLFALAHVGTELAFARLLVFFPGLLFGWLRQRSDSLWPSVVMHAACNVVARFAPL